MAEMHKKSEKLTEKQKKIIAAGSMAVFILFFILACWFIGKPMLKFVSEPEQFHAWIDQHGILGRLAFLGMMVLQIFIAVIPGEPLEIGAGYAFGMWEGTFLCMVGTSIGGLLVFLFVRTFGMKAVEIFFSREKIQSLKFLQRTERRDFWFFLIFLIPGTPKDLLSYVAGLTDMKLSSWFCITTFARIPSIITSTIGGNALGVQNYLFAVIIFAVTLALSSAGVIIYHKICALHKEKSHESTRNY